MGPGDDPDEQALAAIASGPGGPPDSGGRSRGAGGRVSQQSTVASDRNAADVVGGRILGDPWVAGGLAALLLVVAVGMARLYKGRAEQREP